MNKEQKFNQVVNKATRLFLQMFLRHTMEINTCDNFSQVAVACNDDIYTVIIIYIQGKQQKFGIPVDTHGFPQTEMENAIEIKINNILKTIF